MINIYISSWTNRPNILSNLPTWKTKMELFGIQFKFLILKKINLGHLEKDIVIWEIFMKDVCLPLKKTIFHNFHIKNCLETLNKISFKKEKNNYKITIIPFYRRSIFNNYPNYYSFLIQTNLKNKKNKSKNKLILFQFMFFKLINRNSLKKNLIKLLVKLKVKW